MFGYLDPQAKTEAWPILISSCICICTYMYVFMIVYVYLKWHMYYVYMYMYMCMYKIMAHMCVCKYLNRTSYIDPEVRTYAIGATVFAIQLHGPLGKALGAFCEFGACRIPSIPQVRAPSPCCSVHDATTWTFKAPEIKWPWSQNQGS